MSMDESLRPQACAIAQRLRAAGRRVDLVLEDKKMKWAFKVGWVLLGLGALSWWVYKAGQPRFGFGPAYLGHWAG
jgi:hypothetical protein